MKNHKVMKKALKKQNRGFLSIELMVGLGIISAITVAGVVALDEYNKTRLARNVGEHIRQVGEASNKYVNQFTAQIVNYANKEKTVRNKTTGLLEQVPYNKDSARAETGIANLFEGLNCVTATKCKITIDELKRLNFLSMNTNNTLNPVGSDYDIEFNIKYLDAKKEVPVIDGLVVTKKPWTKNKRADGEINYALLGEAVHQAGVDAGFTDLNRGSPNSNKIKGYKEGWELDKADFTNINNPGAIAYRFGFHSGDMLAYLRRDGTLPMTGDLNMGGNKIYFNRAPDKPGGIHQDGDNVIIQNDNGNKLILKPEEVEAEKWLCAKNELKNKICIGGEGRDPQTGGPHDKNAGNFQIRYFSDRPLLVHNTRYGNDASSVDAHGKDYVVFRVGGSTSIHDNLYVGDKGDLRDGKDNTDVLGQPPLNNNAINDNLSGRTGGNIVSNYNINYGNAVLKDDSTPGALNDYNDGNRYNSNGPVAIELNKDGTVIANSLYIKDVPNNSGDNNFDGGLHINQIIPSYSSRGAFVVYDEDLIQKPDCSWHGAPSQAAKDATKKGRPKVILSWGNIHSSGDEVDQDSTNTTTNDPNEKHLRKHRVILKAEDLDPTGNSEADTYWRAIVKTRSFDGSKWVSAGQAVAHIYCQYY